MRSGVDTGGTFTDVVGDDGTVTKVLSTPDDPSQAVAEGLDGARPDLLAHGTTVATNALLERQGAVVALVTNEGFVDVIEIARQDRPALYDQRTDRPEPLVPRELRFEVGGRLDAAGEEIEPVDPDAVPDVPSGVEAVAVCLLHADLCPAHEQAVAAVLADRGLDVTCSSDVSPEFREYERTVTTVLNAYLRPRCRAYLRDLDGLAGEVLVMTSAGGLVPADEAADLPVSLLLSGPAGGVVAAAAAAAAAGFADAVTFDMGGTSTDVCLVQGGMPEPAPGRVAGGFPVRLPALDIQTIGAGGGSIASIDPGGALVVGPRSAGADPGPACYGRGGKLPTVTDADLVLGRIPGDSTFPGLGQLDADAARAALSGAGVSAEGVVAVVDAAMERAVRAVTVERGVDPAGLALVAFGGAGPLHACAIAGALGMQAVVVPPRAGVLSAVGLLCSPRQRDLVRSWPTPGDHTGLADALVALADEAAGTVGGGPATSPSPPPSTAGMPARATSSPSSRSTTSPTSTVAATDTPVAARRWRWSPCGPRRRPPPLTVDDLPPPTAERLAADGPCVMAEPDCTVWIPDGWSATVADDGSWVITR